LWGEIEPRGYGRKIEPVGLVKSFMIAFVLGLPGLRAVAERERRYLGGCNHSALSQALPRPSSLKLVQALLAALPSCRPSEREGLVAVDSMPVTLPSTFRHGCRSVTPTTVGGGVLWSLALDAARGVNPVRLLKVIEGAWHDSRAIRGVQLAAKGPVYLMDRGFYAIDLLARWQREGVRFIVRAKRTHLRYDVVQAFGRPRRNGKLRITLDAAVRLGRWDREERPLLRMVRAALPGGDELILVSPLFEREAEWLLEAYRQRWQIERFHYYLKETLGLAHLYSYQASGLSFLVHVAVLLCTLLLMDGEAQSALTVDRLCANL
jgi:hypothetical protein